MATQCPGTTYKTGDDAFVSIIDGIRKKALSHPDSPALSFLPDGKAENAELCSYSRLDMRARAIAAAIQATGQGDGRPVLLMLPPGLEFIAAFFGCLYARAIAVPMTPPGLARMARTFNRLARIVEDSGSRVFITSARLRKAVEELAERVHFADSIRIICLDETDDALSRSWQELPLTAHTPGWLQYTSGSTSSPKGVIITHGNIMANLDSIAGHMRLRENIPIVSWLPPFHDMGLVGGILTPLHLGCLCVTMPPMAFLRQPLCWLRPLSRPADGRPQLCLRPLLRPHPGGSAPGAGSQFAFRLLLRLRAHPPEDHPPFSGAFQFRRSRSCQFLSLLRPCGEHAVHHRLLEK